ncbi:MAG TPA: hypothetical protein VH186_13440 [Chloroflexia bacterium]|nr:hypothetical protein [Chloroflexia bacterium]
MNFRGHVVANTIKKSGRLLLLALLLTACGESALPTLPPAPTAVSTTALATTAATRAATATATSPTIAATTEDADVALLPTATPPVITPTSEATATPRPEQSVPDLGPSLAAFRATPASFQTAYKKAAARMSGVNGAARLVMAQSTVFVLDHTVWTFFFTIPQGNRTWAVTYDSAGTKDKKELITLVDRAGVLLPDDAGQLAISKILDSDEISTRLLRTGLQPDLPLDTVYLQMVVSTKQGRVPAYLFVNGSLNKQIIVNALTGEVLQNDFI